MKARPLLRSLVRPTVLLPVLLAAALLAFALRLGSLQGMLARMRLLPAAIFAPTLACAAVYLALKALQLRMLLANLGLRIPWRNFGLAFCVGELTATLPFGLFSQNWVMSASSHVHVGRSAAATVMMLFAEAIVVLAVLAVYGIPGWSAVRPAALAVLAGCGAFVFGVVRYEHVTTRVAHKVRHEAARRALLSGIELLGSLRKLSSIALLGANVLLGAAYLGALAYALLLVGHAIGLDELDYAKAAAIYAFALAVVLLGGGAFGQIGTVDVLGMVAARSFGIGYTDGLALMLGFRLVWTASLWVLDLPVVILLWRLLSPQMGAGGSAEYRKQSLD